MAWKRIKTLLVPLGMTMLGGHLMLPFLITQVAAAYRYDLGLVAIYLLIGSAIAFIGWVGDSNMSATARAWIMTAVAVIAYIIYAMPYGTTYRGSPWYIPHYLAISFSVGLLLGVVGLMILFARVFFMLWRKKAG